MSAIAWALFAAAFLPFSFTTESIETTPIDLVSAIKGFRKSVLADTTRINFCKVAVFWRESGAAIDSGMSPAGRYAHRSQCAPPRNELPTVEIISVKNFPDSIVVEGSTRIGNVGRAETYVFNINGPHPAFSQFRICRLTYWD